MSQPSPDARHVARAVDALTTQVRRLADAVSTPAAALGDAPTTTADDGPTRRLHHWFPISQQQAEEMNESASLIQQWAAGAYVQARAAEEDAQRTARRASLRVILDRASRGVILRTDEAALLRQHVEAEQRDADTARQHERAAWDATQHVLELKEERDRSDEAARRALEQRQEMAAERYALQERAEQLADALGRVLREFTQHGHPGAPCVRTPWLHTDTVDRWRAALDGTEQPTTR